MIKHAMLLLAGMALVGACAGSYGKLVTSPASLDRYRHQTLPADLQYYYCGRSGLPYAVIGIDDTYRFNDRVWFRIDTMAEVYEKIENLSDLHPGARTIRASEILDPKHPDRCMVLFLSLYPGSGRCGFRGINGFQPL